MDNPLHQLEQLTKHCVQDLGQMDFEELADFVQQREEIIHKLGQEDLMENEKQAIAGQIQALLQYDTQIVKRMEILKQESADKLGQTAKIRKQRHSYHPAYTPDSLFFDKKK